LVKNYGEKKTRHIKEIKKECGSLVLIINVLKKTGLDASVKRVGARPIIHQFELKYICYLNTKLIGFTTVGYYNLI
jgi:hypothetical protein